MMVVVFAAALVGLIAWLGRLWRLTPAPFWAPLVALVPVALGAWCVVAMGSAVLAAHRVPDTLAVREQVRQVAMHDTRMMRWGLRFWGAAFVAVGWLLFVTWRWEPRAQGER